MKIACPHCRAAFALDDKRVPAAGLSIKCPKCKQPFAVHRARPGDEGKIIEGKPLAVPLPGGPKPAAQAAPPPATVPSFATPQTADAPAGFRPNSDAVPLPGAAADPYAGATVLSAPRPAPGAPPADLYSDPRAPFAGPAFQTGPVAPLGPVQNPAAVPLPGARDELGAEISRANAPAQSGPYAELAPPGIPGELEQPAPGDPDPQQAPAEGGPPAAPSFADIEAASGWSGVQFRDDPVDAPSPELELPAPQAEDPFANIDIEVPDAPARAAPPSDDPFGLDFPIAAAPASTQPASNDGPGFDFVDPATAVAPRADGPSAPSPGLLDFVDDGKAAPKAPVRSNRPPPMIAPTGSARVVDQASTLAADDAAIAAMSAGAGGKKGKAPKPPKGAKPPGEPLGPRLQAALAPLREKLEELRVSPVMIAGGVAIVLLLLVIGLGIRASSTSAGLFWKNLWTSAGKQQSAAAREALLAGEKQLSDGGFSTAREALGTAARTLAALPDDEDARAFFVLCASELKIGWGAKGGDWDQATHVVEKLKEKKLSTDRAIGAYTLASGDIAKAKEILGPLGDAPNADIESVWLYAQTLLRAGEAPHAAQVLDGALRTNPAVKLLLLRGQIERLRGKPDEAVKFFEQALAKSPNSGRALVEVADTKLRAGDLAGAGALLDRALAPEVHNQLDASEDGHASRLRARLADLQHNGKEAEAQFERAARLDPNAAETFAAYGLFRLKRREYDKAAKQFDLALALDAKNPEVLGNAARAYLHVSRPLDADKRMREALEKSPNDARLIFVSGQVAEVIGKLDEAAKEYERALTKKPDLPEALIAQARLAYAAGDKARGLERTQLAEQAPAADKSAIDDEDLTDLWLLAGEPAKAKADALQAQAAEPEDPYADFAMGRALAAQGDLGGARTLYEKSLARIDGDPVMHYELGSLLRRQGNPAAARKELEKAVALDGKEGRFHARLGALLVEQGELEAADAQLHQAILNDDHSAEGLYYLGRAQIAEKKLSDAVDTLKKALLVDPNNALVDYQLGLAYLAGAQVVPAAESFTKSTEKDGKNPDVWEQLGLANMAQNLFADAVAAFKKETALAPERARAWAQLGDAYLQLNETDKAIENLDKSVKLDPGQAGVWAKLGVAFRDRGCDSCKLRAVQALQKATQLAPKDPAAFRELGYLYKDDRKRADAVAAFRRYLELKPDAADADSVKDDIFYLQEEGKRTP